LAEPENNRKTGRGAFEHLKIAPARFGSICLPKPVPSRFLVEAMGDPLVDGLVMSLKLQGS
jgi:hypothetical protein